MKMNNLDHIAKVVWSTITIVALVAAILLSDALIWIIS